MLEEELRALCEKYGPEKILGFIFDNSTRIYFSDEQNRLPFDPDKQIDTASQTLIFTEIDSGGHYYLNCKPLATIQSVMISLGNTPHEEYTLRYIG